MTILYDGIYWSKNALMSKPRPKPQLSIVGFSVPKMNQLYIDKKGDLQRCKATSHSRRAQKRLILQEAWIKPKGNR